MPSMPRFGEDVRRRPGDRHRGGSSPPRRRVRMSTTLHRQPGYRFIPHFHPYVDQLTQRLIEGAVAGLQAADTEDPEQTDGSRRPLFEDYFKEHHRATPLVEEPYPVKELELHPGGAYSVYNWELFFHVPLTLAIHLSRAERFEEAQQWLHYVFDPTDDSDGPTPERFWKFRPFQTTDVELVESTLSHLGSGKDAARFSELLESINAWKEAPFRPHLVARYRPAAYMFKTVMAYLDNLIAWGDSLFRQDTRETLQEATQLYILASQLLGPRPQVVPAKSSATPRTYAELRPGLDAFSNAIVEIEGEIPFNRGPGPSPVSETDFEAFRGLGILYFCVPRNDRLLGYWDTVADRLFKIRNSLDIRGVFRQLPLFEPPIDPGLLARATAAGLDVGDVLSGRSAPLSPVRFRFLISKALEVCREVKSLGDKLLSAIEKHDAEALAILRSRHERAILDLVERARYGQLQEAVKVREGLEQSLRNAVGQYVHFERLLGREEKDIEIPELDELDGETLERMRLRAEEPEVAFRNVEVDIDRDAAGDTGGRMLNRYESRELAHLDQAQARNEQAARQEQIGSILNLIPAIAAKGQPLGVGAGVEVSGRMFGQMFAMSAAASRASAGRFAHEASKAARLGSYARREQEWAQRSNSAAGEINQVYKQLRAAQIREQVARKELESHRQQMAHAEEIERFLTHEKKGKTSNQALYVWMKREVRGLYRQCFQFAFDLAQKAERAFEHELGQAPPSPVRFDHLAGKEGLLAGDKLYLELQRMEMDYHELNTRQYELTKHVSLLQVAPEALVHLRATGECSVSLPEELFDMDNPGHYFRRIRSVALSIPSIVGPYTSVSCTLTLEKSSIRRSAQVVDRYRKLTQGNDSRFDDKPGRETTRIVTSNGRQDSGLFEPAGDDARYLPFEGAGAISTWNLRLPAKVRQFDYDTISDVILHLRYTAKEGGDDFRDKAVESFEERAEEAERYKPARLFSLRQEFPDAWAAWSAAGGATGAAAELAFELKEEHYPFWSRDRRGAVEKVELFAKTEASEVRVGKTAGDLGNSDSLRLTDIGNAKQVSLGSDLVPQTTGEVSLVFDFGDKSVAELWLAVAWTKATA